MSDTPAPATDPPGTSSALLDLEDLDVDLFRGSQPESTRQRVYGGQVAAQALIAGARTVPEEWHVHSLHSYFLLPGDYTCRSSTTSSASGTAGPSPPAGSWPASTAARSTTRPSFQKVEEGFDHQDTMPEVKPPEEGLDLVNLMRGGGNEDADALGKEWSALDVRWLGNSRHGLDPDPEHPSQARMWMRVVGQ